jgi:hypothetical protein
MPHQMKYLTEFYLYNPQVPNSTAQQLMRQYADTPLPVPITGEVIALHTSAAYARRGANDITYWRVERRFQTFAATECMTQLWCTQVFS